MSLRTRALSALLAATAFAGSGVPACAQDAQAEDVETPAGDNAPTPSDVDDPAILVTGTRIRGARVIGEITTLERDAIAATGQVDLGEAIRSLPQNFSGGQNPGVGSGAGLINSNVNSASSANLRGLGPDATLTLLNGHRLPYDSAFAGVDISAIPLAAIDRIEIVPDGASALYGSDAVAGVVNVILRRDFEGITTSGQLGASTEGGNFRQQADVVGGARWSGGGFFVAYDFSNNSAIEARQRSYTASLDPATTLYPSQQRHAVTLSAHHRFAAGIEASLDALYSHRSSTLVAGAPTFQSLAEPEVETYTLAPSLKVDLGSSWQANAVGVFGRDRTQYRTAFTPSGGAPSVTQGCFCNEVVSLEAGAEGPLFALPGGDARLAFGAGFRNNTLDLTRSEGGSLAIAFDKTQRARFAYGELFMPLVSAANGVRGLRGLSLSAAARYEDYPGLDRVATPRFGVLYAPFDGLTVRGSWARSFKAPTLYQRFIPYEAILLPAAAFGAGSGAQTVFLTSGGNPDVKPERARSWTVGAEFRPPTVPELTLSATWYDIRYSDRVVRPIIGSVAAAFRNPGYASLLDFSPDPSTLDALIAGSLFGLENFSGAGYDPANVAAFVDNRNINVAVWAIEGVDARIAWERVLDSGRSIGLDLTGSWLDSSQQITQDLPDVQLAGTVFSPPRYRARATGYFASGGLKLNTAVNYIGTLTDRRFAQAQRIAPSATIDFAVSYDIVHDDGREPGLSVSLSVQNLLNDEPDIIGTTGPTDTPYDSTNYSPIGRFVAIGLRRHW